jgi:hypothetical protein
MGYRVGLVRPGPTSLPPSSEPGRLQRSEQTSERREADVTDVDIGAGVIDAAKKLAPDIDFRIGDAEERSNSSACLWLALPGANDSSAAKGLVDILLEIILKEGEGPDKPGEVLL